MARKSSKSLFVCQTCGTTSPKWLGRCPACGEWESLVQERIERSEPVSGDTEAISFAELDQLEVIRLVTGNREFDRVLGGGIVPGSLVLLGGEPGIGKSTLLLQVAEQLSNQGTSILYIAGEESPQQIKMRGERLGLRGQHLDILADPDLRSILQSCRQADPDILIVDSIQTVFSPELEAVPGSIGQIREAALKFLNFSKEQGMSTLLIGHITKEGSLAGPKSLEHIVDVVLYFEGDRQQNQKIIRTVKNRFGPSNEVGIFEMTVQGLRAVENPSRLFLSQRAENSSGSVVSSAMQGSRPILVEIQALVSDSNFSTARRTANGIDVNRVSLLIAMLEKRLGLQMLRSDVYVNVAGGISLSEPAMDLALIGAIVSSFRDLPIASDLVLFGEVGLAGEIRAVSQALTRVKEAMNLGFQTVVLPTGNLPLNPKNEKVNLIGVTSIAEAFNVLGI